MLCPSARVCGELGARGGSAEGTEPNGDQSRPADSGSVRDRLEGLGPRAPLLRDGEETEKQERRQVASGWVHTAAGAAQRGARVPLARRGPRSRLETGPVGHRAWAQSGKRGSETQLRASAEGLGADEFSQPRLSPNAHLRPARKERVSGLRSGAVVLGFPASQGGAPSVVWASGGGFAGVTIGEGQEEVSLHFVPVNVWREKGVGISCTYSQVFSLFEPLRCVGGV